MVLFQNRARAVYAFSFLGDELTPQLSDNPVDHPIKPLVFFSKTVIRHLGPASARSFSLPGRSISTSGVTGPFRAFPKSLSVDFGGLNHPQGPSLAQSLSQQQPGGGVQPAAAAAGCPNAQDRYSALSQLDGVFSDTGGQKKEV